MTVVVVVANITIKTLSDNPKHKFFINMMITQIIQPKIKSCVVQANVILTIVSYL